MFLSSPELFQESISSAALFQCFVSSHKQDDVELALKHANGNVINQVAPVEKSI